MQREKNRDRTAVVMNHKLRASDAPNSMVVDV